MPIITQSGRIAIAESVAARSLHLAWGSGDGAWTTSVPSESNAATALLSEVGRRAVSSVQFVTPDAVGELVLPAGRFRVSATPTNSLHLQVLFDFADAGSQVIREIAYFAGSTFVPGLPGGQQYFLPAQVATPGRMLHLEYMPPIYRSPVIRPSFSTVITF